MKIRKTFAGNLPDNKIVNSKSNSETDTYICKYLNERNVILDQNSTGYTTESTAAETVPLTQVEKIGGKLSISEDGGIKIGKGVNYVRASGQINYSSAPSDQTRLASYIYKNTSNMSLSSIRSSGTASAQCVVNAPTLIDVKEGDIIYLKARTNDSAGGVTASSTKTTYLYVEVID